MGDFVMKLKLLLKYGCCGGLAASVTLASCVAAPPRAAERGDPGSRASEHRSADDGAFSLEQAIRLASRDNPEIRVLSADIASARGEVTTAWTLQNPEVSVSPGFKRVKDSGPSTTEFHGDFGLEQTIEWPGKRALRRAVAEKNVAMRQLALTGFRSQVAIQVRRVFFTLLASREGVALREQRLALAKTFVSAAQKKVEGGFAPDFEATKAEVEMVSAQKNLREAQARQAAASVALNSLMGRKPTAPLMLVGTLGTGIELPNPTRLVAFLERNPSIRIQEAEVARTGLSLESIRKSRLPDFKVGPSLEVTPHEQTFGIGLSVPLPFWDKKEGAIASATAEQQKALAELVKLRHEILSEVTIASQNLAAAKESHGFYTPALRHKLKAALEAAEQSYAEGKMPLLLYLEAQRTYFDTEADYFETLQQLFEAQAELESSLGAPIN